MKLSSLTRIKSIALALLLVFPLVINFSLPITAYAAQSVDNFEQTRDYVSGDLTDITEAQSGQWWYSYVTDAYSYGIINGKGQANGSAIYAGSDTLTGGEAITIASRMRAIYTDGKGAEDRIAVTYRQTDKWYSPYLAYAKDKKLIGNEIDGKLDIAITRAEAVHIWAKVLDSSDLVPINTVEKLPDVSNTTPYHDEIINFYRAGILSGVDSEGTFNPNGRFTRYEAATIFMKLIAPYSRNNGKSYGMLLPAENTIDYAENVVDLLDKVPAVLNYSSDALTVTISTDIFDEIPKNGDVVVLPPDITYPGGRAIKILGTELIGRNLKLTITEPSIDEVFDEIVIYDRSLPDVQRIVDLANARLEKDNIVALQPAITFTSFNPYDIVNVAASKDNPISIIFTKKSDNSFEIEATGRLAGDSNNSVSFSGKINLALGEINKQIEAYRVNSFIQFNRLDVEIPVAVTSSISVKGQLSKEKSWPLATIPIPTGVPGLYIESILYFKLGINGSIEISLASEQDFTFGASVLSRENYFLPDTPLAVVPILRPNQPSVTSVDVKVKLDAICLELKTSIKIVGLDLISVTPEFGIGTTVDYNSSRCSDVNIAVHLILKINASFLIFEGSYEIWAEGKGGPTFNWYYDAQANVMKKGKCPHISQLTATRGNTIGNIANGGRAAVQGDYIYYADDKSDGRIRKWSETLGVSVLINNEPSGWINVLGEWVYYVNLYPDDNYQIGIYKIRTDGTSRTLLFSGSYIWCMNVVSDQIYFCASSWSTGYSNQGIYKMSIDGSGLKKIWDGYTTDLGVIDDWVYFLEGNVMLGSGGFSSGPELYRIHVDGSGCMSLCKDVFSFDISDNMVYYVNKSGLNKMNLDGTVKEVVIEASKFKFNGGALNISSNWIYFAESFSRLYRLQTDGSQSIQYNLPIRNIEEISSINVAGDWIFFTAQSGWSIADYMIRTDGTGFSKIGSDHEISGG